jgi:hypothetical protein
MLLRRVRQLPIGVNLSDAATDSARNQDPVQGSRIPRSPNPGTISPSEASLVPIALFAAAPFSASQAHRRATSHSMTRFSGRRVYPLPLA